MANCRGCNAPILWALTPADRRAPLDVKPNTAGNTLVWRQAVGSDTVERCATLTGDTLAELVALGVPLRTSHFATCPVVGRFRSEG